MKFVFIDFEASSLWTESFPIEVGYCDVNGTGDGILIKPDASWDVKDGWDYNSAVIHGIPLEILLSEGTHAAEVAAKIHEIIACPDIQLVSDSPGFDGGWLEKLLSIGGFQMPSSGIIDINQAIGHACQPLLDVVSDKSQVLSIARSFLGRAQAVVEQQKTTRHRALPDAQRLAAVYREVSKMVREHLS